MFQGVKGVAAGSGCRPGEAAVLIAPFDRRGHQSSERQRSPGFPRIPAPVCCWHHQPRLQPQLAVQKVTRSQRGLGKLAGYGQSRVSNRWPIVVARACARARAGEWGCPEVTTPDDHIPLGSLRMTLPVPRRPGFISLPLVTLPQFTCFST